MVGDLIVIIDDKKIEKYEDLLDIVGKTTIGKSLKIQVIRQKQNVNLFITVGERP